MVNATHLSIAFVILQLCLADQHLKRFNALFEVMVVTYHGLQILALLLLGVNELLQLAYLRLLLLNLLILFL